MDLDIRGKRALIFGASRGVGGAVVRALAVEGADVAVCARKEWAARKLASEAKENSGVKAAGYGIDARSTDDLVSHTGRRLPLPSPRRISRHLFTKQPREWILRNDYRNQHIGPKGPPHKVNSVDDPIFQD